MHGRTVVAAFVLAAAQLFAASSPAAQQVERAAVRAGPTRSATAVAARAPALPSDASAAASADASASAMRLGRSEKLMIFGGAMFLAGLLIGDDAGTVIAIGGAAVGLYGLYLYLERPGVMRVGYSLRL